MVMDGDLLEAVSEPPAVELVLQVVGTFAVQRGLHHHFPGLRPSVLRPQ